MGLLTKQGSSYAIITYAIGHLLPRILLNIFSVDICSSKRRLAMEAFAEKHDYEVIDY
jgi:hypothetical protein